MRQVSVARPTGRACPFIAGYAHVVAGYAHGQHTGHAHPSRASHGYAHPSRTSHGTCPSFPPRVKGHAFPWGATMDICAKCPLLGPKGKHVHPSRAAWEDM